MGMLSKDRDAKKINKTGSVWWILVIIINLYMMLTVVYTTYQFGAPFIVALPWIIAAGMSKDKKAWIRAALVLLLGYVIHIAIWFYDLFVIGGIEDFLEQQSAMHATMWIRIIFWALLIIYAIRIRKEVDEKIAVVKGNKKDVVKQKEIVRQESRAQASHVSREQIKEEPKEHERVGKIDVNFCGEAEFMTLPGMSLVSAKKAVENRQQNGNYESFDDFVARNNIKPHFMLQMEPMIYIKESKNVAAPKNEKKARTLDL